ncbi:hypothetical protein ONZ45_g12496 [Pleurotus djamor]|nr:hypothetical protein ONZ45_g12496 [Pleurotus djamor]
MPVSNLFTMQLKGDQMVDPFRRAVSQAIQWYNVLVSQIERDVRATISQCDDALRSQKPEHPIAVAWVHPLTECAPILRARCPACFGGVTFGRPFSQGGDFHVAVDGNFHHRQRKHTEDIPSAYIPDYIVPEEQVDLVGERIAKAQAMKTRDNPNPSRVPDVAIDECQHSYLAANGNIAKSDSRLFDSHGLMALVCRHDIPLFATNINTPGEGQKYAVALIEHMFRFIPAQANVVVLYDVGCVLDRSLHKRNIISQDVRDRLHFVTSAMHAYGHQWSCQLEYNPRMQTGLGLTDGEGVERLWSQIRMLIPITRNAAASKRLWLIDQQLGHVGVTGLLELGRWLFKRSKGILQKRLEADEELEHCGVPLEELSELWENQRDDQLSLRSHAPSLLKKEIAAVLKLQDNLDQWKDGFNQSNPTLKRMKLQTTKIQKACDKLKAEVERAYTSLDIPASHPSLKNVPLTTVKLLLLLRELKINIRERACGVFFEMERLDQAVGGRNPALGTRLHQQTRKGISKRMPALRSAIRTYNNRIDAFCHEMQAHKKSKHYNGWYLPIPKHLPEDIQGLQDSEDLMEDVWIDEVRDPPRWLTEPAVRRGIRAMMKKDRCDEETARLSLEADNMCHWLAREIAATEYALQLPENRLFQMPILLTLSRLSALPSLWASNYLPRSRLDKICKDVRDSLRNLGILRAIASPTPTVHLSISRVDESLDQMFDDALCLAEEETPNPHEEAEAALLSDLLEFYDEVDANEETVVEAEVDPSPPDPLSNINAGDFSQVLLGQRHHHVQTQVQAGDDDPFLLAPDRSLPSVPLYYGTVPRTPRTPSRHAHSHPNTPYETPPRTTRGPALDDPSPDHSSPQVPRYNAASHRTPPISARYARSPPRTPYDTPLRANDVGQFTRLSSGSGRVLAGSHIRCA